MTETQKTAGPSIVWFRNDLRLADNPALAAAQHRDEPILCLFILEDDKGLRSHGGASRWWLHHSLASLQVDLERIGARLDLFVGRAADIVPAVVRASNAGAVHFNRRYGGAASALDETIEGAIVSASCTVETFNGRLIREPWEVATKAGGSYGVYTPYWKAAQAVGDPGDPLPRPRKLEAAPYPSKGPKRVSLAALDLLPTKPNWAKGWDDIWTPGEAGATARLRDFLDDDLGAYAEERNILASRGTSRLSPHLRFGEISPRTILVEVESAKTKASAAGATTFLSEVGWREFDYHVMHYHPDVADTNLHRQFDKMPWETVPKSRLDAWKRGQTGFPVVDAGMRELWTTGYMHNRVRMITASFLIKDLLCDWRIGERWFWDCLCDADPANNTLNWQWVAGSGADAAPFFRIFNPVTQGEKFDPDGDYVRRHVPELGQLKGKTIHAPWTLGPIELRAAGIELGKTYPEPMVDHKVRRQKALDAYAKIKG
jgi:deoxyribodipyrimidine photo-lyase